MTASDSYVLEPSQDEIDRLIFVSQFLTTAATETCRRAGLSAGGRAIDIGCGPLGALPALVGIVGENGTVVGVDADPNALRAAQRALDAMALTGVDLVDADINELTPETLRGAPFDLAFCRLVLMHQAAPALAMARIAGLLRPGGSLVAIDFFAPPQCEPENPALSRAWQLVIAAMRAKGASPETSRRYRELCATAGLEVVSERGVFTPIPAAAVVSEAAVLLTGARSTLERAQLTSASEIDDLLDQLRTVELPPNASAYSPQTIELVARVPLAGNDATA